MCVLPPHVHLCAQDDAAPDTSPWRFYQPGERQAQLDAQQQVCSSHVSRKADVCGIGVRRAACSVWRVACGVWRVACGM